MAHPSLADASPPGRLRWLPAPIVILVAAIGGVMWAVTLAKGIVDPDLFWHLTAGELIARTGSVPSVDPFSFTWFGQPWTPHEWLSELAIHWLVTSAGWIGGLMVFGLAPAAILGLLAGMLTRMGVRPLAFGLPAVAGALALAGYVTLRPQAESWLLLAALVWFLAELRPSRPRRALLLVPLFAAWANLHGLYVVGLGVVGIFTIFTLAGRTPMAGARGWMLAGLGGAVAAAMLTPAGPIGILYPLRYVEAGDWGLAHITEWQSPNFHDPAHFAFLGLIAWLGLNGGRNAPGWLVALSWIGVAMGLVALRNVPIAVILALPVLALGLEARLGARCAGRAASPVATSRAVGRRLIEAAAAAAVVIGAVVVLVPRDMNTAIQAGIEGHFPVSGVDRLLELDPDARVLAEYGWGGYVIWRLNPTGGRVFVDGRNDMYDQQVLEDYSTIRDAGPGWEALAERYRVKAMLVAPTSAISRGAAQLAGWCVAYADPDQILLLPECP